MSSVNAKSISSEEKRELTRKILENRKVKFQAESDDKSQNYQNYTYDMFIGNPGSELTEIKHFNEWVESATRDGLYTFESPRLGAQKTEIEIQRETGDRMRLLNFSSYNYLGFGYHPDVIAAAKDALDTYGLGAASSPVISGTYGIHKKLEEDLTHFFGLDDRSISLFPSGYSANVGVIQAYMKPGNHIVMDQSVHTSILEGAKISGANCSYFRHNDIEHLEQVLQEVSHGKSRVLVCVESLYGADGDYGDLSDIVRVVKNYQASILVDEAHSTLIAGENGRGVSEESGVLEDIDLYVITFSKAFSGVGGALLAKKEVVRYVNWYAKCRMFSCALDPAVTGGMIKVLELASGPEGEKRRRLLRENAAYFRKKLAGKVDMRNSKSWIVPVIFGSERNTLKLNDFLQREGFDGSILQFPSVPKNEARIRIFITSEHTRYQLDRGIDIILKAAEKFKFLL
ncbi:MAG: aminotransferase class I/II-fold pyridoxal phosphate-dependent enzyme [Candidatus Jettenia sp.]|uniref:Glycine C-acetyltransferase n=1 Tax=Candidatus Jettenia caeni TaxID=247490 RepID=I3IP60_9BACT|nr:aminotransferase class I/II-fold pyridoxal phosphate-dependent enzyme [Candidatus Jettenia sp. AMX1]MBC6930549.1 aminotransferase class I/II-fold pyridoxal phosphate-dependent enzyme [Candidatus Jettenia sp.]NUN24288.1 aminotransferase class I/II-fold pyridoxal phosphate-dependent enzyme [Candidatus Jettenia caeni]KAA0246937.1 MAG: aminotransferase class I/II-fold pyridoxal phosphate-dependent enzyme [Candidatus Jettenia sp. AMX1]MCE7882154.1 aminotransferase class I/II-fold pyridoxal phosph